MARFSIIIVTYESGDWIEACLDALKRQTFNDFEVIVVDNASADDSVEKVRASDLSLLKLIESEENTGFSGGCNQGAAVASGEWLVFLNPDTVARENWLEEIAAGQARHPDAAMFACTQYELLKDSDEDITRLDGAGDAYFGFGFPWRGGFQWPLSALPEEGECFSPCGASAVICKDLFAQCGGFDERFFCYCEDVDLGFRLRLMGERCVYLPNAAVDHIGSATLGRYSDFNVFHGARNRMWTYIKNMPLGLLIVTAPGHIFLSFVLLVMSIRHGKVRATIRGLVAGLGGAPKMWASRKSTPRSANVYIAKAMCWNFNTMRTRKPHVWPAKPSSDR